MRWSRRSSTASSEDSNSSKRGKPPRSSFRGGSTFHSISRSGTSSSSNGTLSREPSIVSSRSGTTTSATSISIHSLERRNQEQADQEGKDVMQLYNHLRQKELQLYGDPSNIVSQENIGKRSRFRKRLKRFTGWGNRSAIRPSQSREPMDSRRSSWFGFTSVPSGTRYSNAIKHNAKFASRWSSLSMCTRGTRAQYNIAICLVVIQITSYPVHLGNLFVASDITSKTQILVRAVTLSRLFAIPNGMSGLYQS